VDCAAPKDPCVNVAEAICCDAVLRKRKHIGPGNTVA
jgi:hypothetical protein